MLQKYELANLVPLLETIRRSDRYSGMDGVNVLTNAAFGNDYNKGEVVRELQRASVAGSKNDRYFAPDFSHSKQGFSFGLNPYTDWSLAQLERRPTHYYLFLGLDWYSISGLGNTNRWFEYLRNPFDGPYDKENPYDKYWHNLWAWIMRRFRVSASGIMAWDTPIAEEDAANFVRTDGGAFVFHNRIPYLRPAGEESAGSDWYEMEWEKDAVRRDATEDLRLLRKLAEDKIIAFCTCTDSVKALRAAGYLQDQIISWRAHPSRVFHPSVFSKKDLWFKGRNHFKVDA